MAPRPQDYDITQDYRLHWRCDHRASVQYTHPQFYTHHFTARAKVPCSPSYFGGCSKMTTDSLSSCAGASYGNLQHQELPHQPQKKIRTHCYDYAPQGNILKNPARSGVPKTPLSGTASINIVPAISPPKSHAPPSKGLRHFSMKVCQKVQGKGTTSYNEVADELIREIREEEACIDPESSDSSTSSKKKRNGSPPSSYDEKNIRRRVYDALNVLMAMDIIVKDKKLIVWNGLPGDRTLKSGSNKRTSKSSDRIVRVPSHKILTTNRIQSLQEELTFCQAEITMKKECLQELIIQKICFNNLVRRNQARETSEGTLQLGQSKKRNHDDNTRDERIPLPFIVINANSNVVIQCDMCPEKVKVNFDFSLPFEINDDNEILKRIGMDYTTKEELECALPRNLYYYCIANRLLKSIII